MPEGGSSGVRAVREALASDRPSPAARKSFNAIEDDIARGGFAFRPGKEMGAILGARALDEWPEFAASWDDLGIDTYMADGGRYRRRRFCALSAIGTAVSRKEHQPHYQSRDHNRLNGGVERWFMPVHEAITGNAFAQALVRYCAVLFERASSTTSGTIPWHVEMHQFRIEATQTEQGAPTPEGPHRDGVDWVCVMLINRTNVRSGVTQIFDPAGRSLGEFTLTNPIDTVFLDDHRVFHGVTPIAPLDSENKANRDVLVLTYRREQDFNPAQD